MEPVEKPLLAEPGRWTLVFHRKSSSWLTSLIAMGRYKHVSAFAYIAGLKLWLVYDVRLGGTSLTVVQDCPETKAALAQMIVCADLMLMERQHAPVGIWPPLYCAGAIRHLLRLPGDALRPDALWRLCLRHGGEAIIDEATFDAQGPEPCRGAGARPA
jgi:hypothetical protein